MKFSLNSRHYYYCHYQFIFIVLLFSDQTQFDISAQPHELESFPPTVWTKPDKLLSKQGKWTSWHTVPHDIQHICLDFVDCILIIFKWIYGDLVTFKPPTVVHANLSKE
jgi:hypothetical protein